MIATLFGRWKMENVRLTTSLAVLLIRWMEAEVRTLLPDFVSTSYCNPKGYGHFTTWKASYSVIVVTNTSVSHLDRIGSRSKL